MQQPCSKRGVRLLLYKHGAVGGGNESLCLGKGRLADRGNIEEGSEFF